MKFTDREKAVKELVCYLDSLQYGVTNFEQDRYLDAAIHLENAARSLKELERLKVHEEKPNNIVNIFVVGRHGHGKH